MACGILVSRPRIEPAPPALEAWNLNHWITREVPWPYRLDFPVSCVLATQEQERKSYLFSRIIMLYFINNVNR